MVSLTLQWYGLSCFRITAKTEFGEIVVVTDPFDRSIAKLPRNFTADIVTVSHGHNAHSAVEQVAGDFMLIDRPGEYEAKNIFVYGISSSHGDGEKPSSPNFLYRFEFGDISLAHLGDIGHGLTNGELERLENVDVLLVPVGNQDSTIGAKEAVGVVNTLEPRIVIPMHFSTPGIKKKLDSANAFFKELGATPEEVSKLKIQHKDLPQDKTQYYLFSRT